MAAYSLPPLEYSLSARRRSQIIFVCVLLFANAILPNLLFYLLRHLTKAPPVAIYGAVSACFAFAPIVKIPMRAISLLKQGGQNSCVPHDKSGPPAIQLDDSKWYQQFDVFQWEIFVCTMFTTILFVLSCTLNGTENYFPLLVLAPSSLVALVSVQVMIFSSLTLVKFRAPFRVGSVPKGEYTRPATYHIWEDLVAVDGGGGAVFRKNLDARYRASPPFQVMFRNVGFLMGGFGVTLLGMICGVTFSGASMDVVYGTSIGITVVWAFLGVLVARYYCKRALQGEEKWFQSQITSEEMSASPLGEK